MAATRVVQLTACVVAIPLKRPIRHASHVRTSTENVIVRCALSDGCVGWGEGVPREYVTGETADSAFELLRATDWSKITPACTDFDAAVRLAEQLKLPAVPGDERQCQGNAARCAIELAILDAFGRSFGEPLSAVTELLTPELYQFRDHVQYSGVITSSRGWKLRALSLGYRLTGFRQVKVKVGIEGYDDKKRLATVRRWLGSNVGLRVDANEAWKPTEVTARMSELAAFNLEGVEQPVAHEFVSELCEIRKQIKSPIILDESLCGRFDAQRAIAGQWCDRFNLRLSKCGGFIPTLRLAQLAATNGLTCQLGCQVGESAILTTAGRHFACSVRDLTAVEGSFDRHLVAETLAFYDHTFGRGGWAPALGGSGHGALVDEAAVTQNSRRSEVLFA